MIFPLQSFLSNKSAVNQKLALAEYNKRLNFYSIEDVMEYLTININDAFNAIFARLTGTVDMKFAFSERHSRLVISAINTGARKFIAPYSNLLVDAWGANPSASEGQIMTWRTNNQNVIQEIGDPKPSLFSIVVNRAIRDMFPRLPWREVNNEQLEPVDPM